MPWAAGWNLALCCHFRFMADTPKAKIGLTELNLGIIPGWGGTQRLYRVVGKSRALDMILFSRCLDAREALTIGLVDQISDPDQLMMDVLEFAGRLSARPPIAVRAVLKAMSAGIYEGLDQGLAMELEGSQAVKNYRRRKRRVCRVF